MEERHVTFASRFDFCCFTGHELPRLGLDPKLSSLVLWNLILHRLMQTESTAFDQWSPVMRKFIYRGMPFSSFMKD